MNLMAGSVIDRKTYPTPVNCGLPHAFSYIACVTSQLSAQKNMIPYVIHKS